MSYTKLFSVLSALVFLVGCGSEYPSVSGTVTANGQPVEGIKVLFSPVSTRDNPFPGPYAQGTTDKNGSYSLVTRDGSSGGTVGENIVELYSTKGLETDFMESKIALQFNQSGGDRNHPAWKSAVALKEKVKSLKAMSSKGTMMPAAKTSFTVPEEGSDSVNFELMDFADSNGARR